MVRRERVSKGNYGWVSEMHNKEWEYIKTLGIDDNKGREVKINKLERASKGNCA